MSKEKQSMQEKWQTSYLNGASATYVEALYEHYLKDPKAVPDEWRNYFTGLAKSNSAGSEAIHSEAREFFTNYSPENYSQVTVASTVNNQQLTQQYDVVELIEAYRRHGHMLADLDPLGLQKKPQVAELEPGYHNLSLAASTQTFMVEDFAGLKQASLSKLLDVLKKTYCSTVGVEYMHINNQEEIDWLKQRWEKPQGGAKFSTEEKKRILEKLVAAAGLEIHLGSKYVGQKRFSLEGGDTLIPMLDQLVQQAGSHSFKEIVLGMAHRGRLNVLINTLGKSPSDLFAEFEGKLKDKTTSGDVKYHMGFSSDVKTSGGTVHLAMAFNPSHLEIIAPVVQGSVRSRQTRYHDTKRDKVLPIVLHGDASFAGQGVVMETFNMSQTRGFGTGGTVHIVINNQVGFTTSNRYDARSTLYCTDVAKIVEAPIFHVNGDDPEAAVFVTQLALDYRIKFKKDVVIDLVCYRRHGHNEADEPLATQPVMYNIIKKLPRTYQKYAEQLAQENLIAEDTAEKELEAYRDRLNAGKPVVAELAATKPDPEKVDWEPHVGAKNEQYHNTKIKKSTLIALANKLEKMPDDFELQAQVAKVIEARQQMTVEKIAINWGYAETLAYASLLNDGYGIRLSGQDSRRGTFAHRHATLYDQKTGQAYTPLEHIPAEAYKFEIIDSLLSEEAVVAFEYGYASADPNTLVIWEAQFGDFFNGAQVVLDQFISSGEQKWARLCGLVLLLPHGYEGMGPEHSSARLERFMQLCAQHNMQVCTPTTPAQIFHLLRRQIMRQVRKPLIIMSPKSLLRHKLAVSSLADLATGQFQLLIPEIEEHKEDKLDRVVLCGGKVYYDLIEYRQKQKKSTSAIVRIEQLYPFPKEELKTELARYKKAKRIIWCQEEPKNQGAWFSIKHKLQASLAKGQTLEYAGRRGSASPATGYAKLHREEQLALVEQALLS